MHDLLELPVWIVVMAAVVVHEFDPKRLKRLHDLAQDRIDRQPEAWRIGRPDCWDASVVGDLVEITGVDLVTSIVEAPRVDVDRQVVFVIHELHHRDLVEQTPLSFIGLDALHHLVGEIGQVGHAGTFKSGSMGDQLSLLPVVEMKATPAVATSAGRQIVPQSGV